MFFDIFQMCDFIESEFLEEQVNAIKEISDHITQLKRVGTGLGEYEYDKQLQSWINLHSRQSM